MMARILTQGLQMPRKARSQQAPRSSPSRCAGCLKWHCLCSCLLQVWTGAAACMTGEERRTGLQGLLSEATFHQTPHEDTWGRSSMKPSSDDGADICALLSHSHAVDSAELSLLDC